jgi:signal transduction histidine kinase/ActR/RegA family two-component response regulator
MVLIVPFVIQLAFVAGLVGYISSRNGQRAVNEVAHDLRSEIAARIEEHLRAFLATPHGINRINANALRQGVLDATDPAILERYFWEQLQIFDSVTSIYFGNTAGGLVDAGRESTDASLYVIVTDGFAQGTFNKYATDALGNRTALVSAIPDFDARTRSWYTGAVEKGDATWSDVYLLFTGNDLAIAASRPVYDAQQNLLGVVSIDIFTSHLSNFLRSLEIGKTGQSFIMERSGLLVASSTAENPFTAPNGTEAQRRLFASESSVPLIRSSAEFLTERLGSYDAITGDQQFEFELEGQRQFLQVSPFHDDYGIDWLIVVVIPESDFMAQIQANNRTTTLLIVGALALAVIIGIVTARWITRPVSRLKDSAQALARGEWQQVTAVDRIDELDALTRAFNTMAGQLKQTLEDLISEVSQRTQAQVALQHSNRCLEGTLDELKAMQEQMMQQERMAAVGQMAAGIAHDFNNIMASIVLYAQMTARATDLPPYVQERMVLIDQQAQQASRLIQQILDFSRRAVLNRKRLDLLSVLKEQVKLLSRTLPENIETALDYNADVYFIKADEARIKQIVTNLALNARDAMPEGGKLRFALERIEVKPNEPSPVSGMGTGAWVALSVSDTGTGIPDDVLPYIFEPFFTTKAPLCSGLGLAQVHGIVAQHGGHIGVKTQVGKGTTFAIYLPALPMAENSSMTVSPLEMPMLAEERGGRILVVEDDAAVRKALVDGLESFNYQTLEAESGKSALAILEQRGADVVLVLSDRVMPGMGGSELFQALRQQGLTVPVILLSGQPMEEVFEALRPQGGLTWLLKPTSLEQLAQAVAKALSKPV